MKNISIYTILTVLTIISALLPTSLSAQRIFDPPYNVSHFNGANYSVVAQMTATVRDTVYQSIDIDFSDSTLFQDDQKNFLFGYHWGGGTNSALERRWHINMPMGHYGWHWNSDIQMNQEFDSTNAWAEAAAIGPKQYFIWQYVPLMSDYVKAPAIEWQPAAPYTTHDSIFHPIPGDTSGAVFGFKNREGGIAVADSTDENFMRYVLTPDSVGAGANNARLVLSKPMLHTSVKRFSNTLAAKNDLSSPAYHESLHNGTKWYLSCNLRRLNDDTTAVDTDKVVGLKIKYWYRHNPGSGVVNDSSNIKFDSVFAKSNAVGDTMHHARGITHKKLYATNDTTSSEFVIRRKDIPVYGSVDSLRDISLSAFFRTTSQDYMNDNSSQYHAPNPWFKIGVNSQVGEIDSIDIRVTYYGNCPIAVSGIRLESPRGREFLWGYGDSVTAVGMDRAVKNMKRIQAKYPTKTLRH